MAEPRDTNWSGAGLRSVPEAPGAELARRLEENSWSQGYLAKRIGKSRQFINQIIKGHSAISFEMSALLSLAFGMDEPDYWAQRQFEYASFQREHELHPDRDLEGEEEDNAPSARMPKARAASADGHSILVDHQIMAAVKEGILTITGFDVARVQPASYDLTIGTEALVLGEMRNDITLSATKSLVLKPGESALVACSEEIKFPGHFMGRLGAATRLIRRGIIVANGLQVDPGYEGRVWVLLQNVGGAPVTLNLGDTFLSLEFHRLSMQPMHVYRGEYQFKKTMGPADKRDFAGENNPMVSDTDGMTYLTELNREGYRLTPGKMAVRFDKDDLARDRAIGTYKSLERFGYGGDQKAALNDLAEGLVNLFAATQDPDSDMSDKDRGAILQLISRETEISKATLLELAGHLNGETYDNAKTGVIWIKLNDETAGKIEVRQSRDVYSADEVARGLRIDEAEVLDLVDDIKNAFVLFRHIKKTQTRKADKES